MDEQQPVDQRRPFPQQETRINHNISTVEWGLVIGALAVIDLAQVILDLFAIGIAANRFIDIVVGGFLALYKQLRCKNISGGKWAIALIATFVGEEIPIADALPLWVLDGFYMMTLERAGEKAKQMAAIVPGGQKALRTAVQRATPPQVGTREPVRNFEDTRRAPLNLKNMPPPKQGPAKVLEMQKFEQRRTPRQDIPSIRENILEENRARRGEIIEMPKQSSNTTKTIQETHPELLENDLIVSDTQVMHAKELLKSYKIPFNESELTKRRVVDSKTGSVIPGEFILSIHDPQHLDRPASPDFVKQVFELIKDSDIPVRYGRVIRR